MTKNKSLVTFGPDHRPDEVAAQGCSKLTHRKITYSNLLKYLGTPQLQRDQRSRFHPVIKWNLLSSTGYPLQVQDWYRPPRQYVTRNYMTTSDEIIEADNVINWVISARYDKTIRVFNEWLDAQIEKEQILANHGVTYVRRFGVPTRRLIGFDFEFH